jgi:hypothetical protein
MDDASLDESVTQPGRFGFLFRGFGWFDQGGGGGGFPLLQGTQANPGSLVTELILLHSIASAMLSGI